MKSDAVRYFPKPTALLLATLACRAAMAGAPSGAALQPAAEGMMYRSYEYLWDESRLLENPYKG